ncbi:MAG: Gfo/Idh/MocA family oxidoreductase [Rhodospirillales bacterium]|nr:Gfo/Idh/MocA family oxidoreductase [Rhodospirillales bacterium]
MKVGIIGCGYVFDKYMPTWGNHPELVIAGVSDIDPKRVDAVTRHYGLKAYTDNAALLADPEIDIVANFTPIRTHYEVSKAALEAGKHVYSEKPLVTRMDQARELIDLAESRGLRVSCAPSNVLGATSQTMWKAMLDGAIGRARMVYAEFDADPCYMLGEVSTCQPEPGCSFPYLDENSTRSVTGAFFPFVKEFEMGCTYEHVAYHLSWMCAMFGPVKTVTAFSKVVMPDKTDAPLDPADTPDFSVAVMDFHSGVAGRVTCSINGANDLRMRIIGDRGILTTETYGDYKCPVYLDLFSKLSVKTKHLKVVRNSPMLQWVFGVAPRELPLVPAQANGSRRAGRVSWWDVRGRLAQIKQAELNRQDKCVGIGDLAAAISSGRPHYPSHDFTLHMTELTLAIQAAGTRSQTHVLETTFHPVELPEWTRQAARNYREYLKPLWRTRLTERALDALKG